MTEDQMAGWHHRFSGHEFEQPSVPDERQGSLACCSLWGCRVRHDLLTEQRHAFSKENFWPISRKITNFINS